MNCAKPARSWAKSNAKLSSQGPAHSSGRLLIIAVFASLAVRQYQRLSR
jgi:hypothetical protein